MASRRWMPTVLSLMTCFAAVWSQNTSAVVMKVRQAGRESNLISVTFSQDLFDLFYECMCSGTVINCTAFQNESMAVVTMKKYGESSAPSQKCPYYTCTNDDSSLSLTCTLQSSDTCPRSVRAQAVRNTASKCGAQTCVSFLWTSEGETLVFSPSVGNVVNCDVDDCGCSTTTAATTITTTRTTRAQITTAEAATATWHGSETTSSPSSGASSSSSSSSSSSQSLFSSTHATETPGLTLGHTTTVIILVVVGVLVVIAVFVGVYFCRRMLLSKTSLTKIPEHRDKSDSDINPNQSRYSRPESTYVVINEDSGCTQIPLDSEISMQVANTTTETSDRRETNLTNPSQIYSRVDVPDPSGYWSLDTEYLDLDEMERYPYAKFLKDQASHAPVGSVAEGDSDYIEPVHVEYPSAVPESSDPVDLVDSDPSQENDG